MKIIDTTLLDKVSAEAKVSPRRERTITFISRWRISAIDSLMPWSQELR